MGDWRRWARAILPSWTGARPRPGCKRNRPCPPARWRRGALRRISTCPGSIPLTTTTRWCRCGTLSAGCKWSIICGFSMMSSANHAWHQFIPFTSPGWDASKFAVAPSLASFSSLRLGVSLYGAAAYGKYFDPWYRRTRHPSYGITEFHPLKALPWPQLQAVLDGHARQGADFLSFFLEPRWQGRLVERKHNEFSLDPANDRFGSDALYRALAQGLAREIDAPRQASAAP